MLKPLRPIALIAAAAALSACSTVSRIGGALNPFDGVDEPQQTAPQDGRVSILAFEQALTPDTSLAGRAILVPPPVASSEWSQPGGTADNSPAGPTGVGNLERAWRTGLGQGSTDRVQIAAPLIPAAVVLRTHAFPESQLSVSRPGPAAVQPPPTIPHPGSHWATQLVPEDSHSCTRRNAEGGQSWLRRILTRKGGRKTSARLRTACAGCATGPGTLAHCSLGCRR